MSKAWCANCKKEVQADAEICPYCGVKFNPSIQYEKKDGIYSIYEKKD